mgnify:CR=1 FL=1
MDLKKAFDTVDHGILSSKLNIYGFRSVVSNWFKSYLSDHSQKCYVNDHLSNKRTLLCGIPQGTILGPYIVYIVYISLVHGFHAAGIVLFFSLSCNFRLSVVLLLYFMMMRIIIMELFNELFV